MQILGAAPDKTNVIELWNVDEGKLVRTFDIKKQSPTDPPYDQVELGLFADDDESFLFTFVPGDRGVFLLPLDGASKCIDLTEKCRPTARTFATGQWKVGRWRSRARVTFGKRSR